MSLPDPFVSPDTWASNSSLLISTLRYCQRPSSRRSMAAARNPAYLSRVYLFIQKYKTGSQLVSLPFIECDLGHLHFLNVLGCQKSSWVACSTCGPDIQVINDRVKRTKTKESDPPSGPGPEPSVKHPRARCCLPRVYTPCSFTLSAVLRRV